jgi:D-glycero-alpha-D-manno-heptose-7-phosphate kinase
MNREFKNYVAVSCPVRLSLLGGSSDLDSYLDRHGRGSVISFTPSLYTYVSVYRDALGRNNLDSKYIVNYSKREETQSVDEIRNDLVREFFKTGKVQPCSVHMTSDVFSHGSGLAVSSSYSCSLAMALQEFQGKQVSQTECGVLANRIEKTINPLLGQQDVFGCCVGGFKKIEFSKTGLPKYTFLPTDIFECYDVCLLFTGYTRSSTDVLKTVTVPTEDVFNPIVSLAEQCLMNRDYRGFMGLIREGWTAKKRTSDSIVSPAISEIDSWLSSNKNCVSHKLCGAGNGGFFLCFFNRGTVPDERFYPVGVSPHGVRRLV